MRTLFVVLACLTAPVLAQGQRPPASTPQSMVRGRLLGLDGAVLPDADLQAMFVATYAYYGHPCRSGADGEVQIAVPESFSQAQKSRLVVMRRQSTGLQPTVYGGAVSVDLPPSPHGVIQAGDLRLQEEPVLVSGTVVDKAGRPIEGIAVTTQVSQFVSVQNYRLKQASTVMGGVPFSHVAVSDAKGRFVMRELTPADTPLAIRLLNEETWQLAEAPVAKPGTTDLRVEVAHTAAILVGMAGAPRDGVSVRVERHGEHGGGRPYQTTPEGLLRFGRLQPGSYDVRLVVQGEVVWSAEGVEVHASEDCADSRLQSVPWREHARLVKVSVRDRKGQAVQALIAVRRAESPDQPMMFRTDQEGKATLGLLAKAPGTMEISTPEHLTMWIEDPKGEIDARLEPRPKVRVTVPPELQLPAGTVVQLGEGRNQVETTVQAGKDTILRPDGAGQMPVRLCVRSAKNEFQQAWAGSLDVAPFEAMQEKVLEVDPKSVERLRELLAAKKH